MMHMMKDYFYAGSKATILFSFWKTETPLQLLIACLIVPLISFSYEAVKALRYVLLRKEKNKKPPTPSEDTKLTTQTSQSEPMTRGPFNIDHFLQTFLYWIQVWLGIISMLVYMTFNAYLCLAISLGNVVGYFIVSWWSTNYANRDLEDNCC